MQNDVLKNNIAPWQEKGRWYHGVWDMSVPGWITEETDDIFLLYTVSVSSYMQYIYPDTAKLIVIDSKIIPRGKLVIPNAVGTFVYRFATTGNNAVPIAPVGTSGIVDVYVFIKPV